MAEDMTPLQRIAAFGTKAEAVALLNSNPGLDINATDDWGATALHYAASKGNLALVTMVAGTRR
jgi:ankyrin repeat protein